MDLGITIPRSGRRPAAIEVSYLRDLDSTDLALLFSGGRIESITPGIRKVRHAHHELARLLATGVKSVEASAITGYSQSRISILQRDPAFKNLLSYYSSAQQEVFVEVANRLKVLGLDAIQEISSRLEEAPEEFSNEELRKLSETVLDRAGFGPKSTVAVEHGLSAEALAALKHEVNSGQKGKVIEATHYSELDDSGTDEEPTTLREENPPDLITSEGDEVSEESREVVAEEVS